MNTECITIFSGTFYFYIHFFFFVCVVVAFVDHKFAAFVDGELRSIKDALRAEGSAREAEDDATELSVTAFARKLQSSLQVINAEI